MEVKELMKCMLDLFNNIDKVLENERAKLSEKDMELSDLDHYLEGTNNLKAGQYAKIGKLRKILREERRCIKNNVDMILTIKRFTDKFNNKLIAGDILQNLKAQEELEKKQESPVYVYRTNVIDRLKGDTNEEKI